MVKILTIKIKKDNDFLRRKTSAFDFKKFTKKEIQGLVQSMNKMMVQADGIGLAANQIGLDLKMFVAKVDRKFYAIFNPEITKLSDTFTPAEEGCLSVPEMAGDVFRPERISLEGYDRNGKKIKIKAWGVLARVFQHEMDHLNGKLFIDRIKEQQKFKIK